jgi:hypothetical protein
MTARGDETFVMRDTLHCTAEPAGASSTHCVLVVNDCENMELLRAAAPQLLMEESVSPVVRPQRRAGLTQKSGYPNSSLLREKRRGHEH